MSTTALVSEGRVAEGDSMIRVEGLTKKFGDFVAVDDVSFDVKKGEIFGLLGPNGAGKSTTLRILSTLARPTKGTATIGGYDIVNDDTEVRKLIGIVSEKMIMYDRLTARENLWFFGSLFDIPRDVLTKRIDELLDLVQLTKWKDAQVGTFSTGMRQRMNVVRSLLNMPRVLFLDEPTLGLDPQSSVEIREFVKKLNRENGTTIIVTTHTMVDADMLCNRIAIIDHGKVVALDTSSGLKKLISGEDSTVLKLGIANLTTDLLESLRTLDCVKSASQEGPTQIRLIARGRRRLRRCDRRGEAEGREDNIDRERPADARGRLPAPDGPRGKRQRGPEDPARVAARIWWRAREDKVKLMGAKTLLSHSFRIAWKDLLELERNKFGLVLLIVMPLFMLGMVGFIYPTSGNSVSNAARRDSQHGLGIQQLDHREPDVHLRPGPDQQQDEHDEALCGAERLRCQELDSGRQPRGRDNHPEQLLGKPPQREAGDAHDHDRPV